MAGDMATLKVGVELLMRRLVGTWDFVLDVSQYPDSTRHCYIMQGISDTGNDIVVFGHTKKDNIPFNIILSPKTIDGNEYIFYLDITKKIEKDRYHFSSYFFNQRADRISGAFHVREGRDWLLSHMTPTIASGHFMGFRRPEVT